MNRPTYIDNLALPVANGLSTIDDERSSWTPVDLTDALAGIDVPPPTLLARTDNACLLYAGRIHQFAGESESCKTWAALAAVAAVLMTGGTVLWVDFEDDANGIVARLRSLMVPVEAIEARFTYLRPEEPLAARDGRATAGGVDFGAVVNRSYTLAIVDGVTEAMTTEGLELMSNTDVAVWSRRVPKRIAKATGAAVVVIDHVTKNAETRGRYALGGGHKLAGLTGAAYRFDIIRRIKRATSEPVTGAVMITITKDRPGHVRAHSDEERAGVLELTSYPDGGMTITIIPPGGADSAPDSGLINRIVDHLERYDGSTKNGIMADVEGKQEAIRAALKWMAAPERLWISIERVGQSHRHSLTDKGREELL